MMFARSLKFGWSRLRTDSNYLVKHIMMHVVWSEKVMNYCDNGLEIFTCIQSVYLRYPFYQLYLISFKLSTIMQSVIDVISRILSLLKYINYLLDNKCFYLYNQNKTWRSGDALLQRFVSVILFRCIKRNPMWSIFCWMSKFTLCSCVLCCLRVLLHSSSVTFMINMYFIFNTQFRCLGRMIL